MLTSQVGLSSSEKTGDLFIMSRKIPCGPFSFVDKKKHVYNEQNPPPVYLPLDDLNFQRDFDFESIFENFEIQKNGELKLNDEELQSRQKGVFYDIFKNLSNNFLSGKKIVGMSLPIKIFEPRSTMERLLDAFHLFPYYIKKAYQNKDTVERIKLILASIVGSIPHTLSQAKPFNPLIGETFSGKFDEETEIYCEHICHHPSISYIQILNPQWKLYGKITYNCEIGFKRFIIFNEGWLTLEMSDGEKFQFKVYSGSIKGIISGTRYYRPSKEIIVFQPQKKIKGIIKIGQNSQGFGKILGYGGKYNVMSGEIFQYDDQKHWKMFDNDNWLDMGDKMCQKKDLIKSLCKISGDWLKNLYFDEQEFWNINQNQKIATQQQFHNNPLPSEGRFREDLIWLLYGNEQYAQQWKYVIEAQQKLDRQNRLGKKVQLFTINFNKIFFQIYFQVYCIFINSELVLIQQIQSIL